MFNDHSRLEGMDMPSAVSRRSVLAGMGSGATVFGSGCLRRTRNLTGWEDAEPVQLQIKTLPTDSDPYALELARAIAEWFNEAGVETDVLPMPEQELLRQSLLRTEFDMFVIRLPAQFREPDALFTLLHSRFSDKPGWQNPFGYTDLDTDGKLERQRRSSGDDRHEALEQLQRQIARTQPFTLLTVPDDIRTALSSTAPNWSEADLRSPLGYLQVSQRDESTDATLRVVGSDPRATTNLNPLSVEFRRSGVLTGLLYDPLARVIDGTLHPWLAESFALHEGERTVRVRLRESVTWHDGESLTAGDVAFTHRLLADTTLDEDTGAEVPSPQFRGESSLVEAVSIVDERTLDIEFIDAEMSVAARALTVPILPEHIWSDRTDAAEIGGIPLGTVTDVLVTNNIPPVGSGPFEFVENTPRERLLLERTENHFSTREEIGLPKWVTEPSFEAITVNIVGSDVTAVEMVSAGSADVTGTPVGAETVPRIGRPDGTELLVGRSERPYILGYNTRRSHLENPRFRNTLARLIDEPFLGDHVLDGYAHAAVGPLNETEWYPAELSWEDQNPIVPFIGEQGQLDLPAARNAFREAGYQYENGTLIGGGT